MASKAGCDSNCKIPTVGTACVISDYDTIRILKTIPTNTVLNTGHNKMPQIDSRRRGGVLASAAKLFLVATPLRTRLVSETIWFLIGSDQCRQRSTPSSPKRSQTPFCFNFFLTHHCTQKGYPVHLDTPK